MQRKTEIVPWRCHVCGKEFDTPGGGICGKCNKPTCKICLGVGALYQVSKAKDARAPICKSCAKAKEINWAIAGAQEDKT
jgi:hypothetical protein